MVIRSLAELRRADGRTLAFAPEGLLTGARMRAEDAAVFQQEVISHAELAPKVGESTRNTFDRLRSLHAYGVLFYDAFTIVDDLAHLLIEQALRERFVEFYGGTVPFEDGAGVVYDVPAAKFDVLYDEIHQDGRLRKRQRWRLRLRRTGELIYFDGMLDSLLRWARGEGLLRGQRNRKLEPLLTWFRNYTAHGPDYHLGTPVDAARTISDAAETINQLWGVPTPGGRFYPAPIRREIQAVGWSPGGSVISGPADDFRAPEEYEDWPYVLVRAVPHDPGLIRVDARFETTSYPCDLLWGPGSWRDAAEWLKEQQPAADEVEILDRLFLIQHDGNRVFLPRSADVAAGLDDGERRGTWYLIRADFPADTVGHTRQLAGRHTSCAAAGPCEQCAAETVGIGNWQEMIDLAAASGISINPRRPPDARLPSPMGWPRYTEILGTGTGGSS
jgi:hypothetical protein